MDHLDYWSVCELIDKNKVKFWVVPLGIKSWLMGKAGVPPEDIIELEWWEGVRLSKSSNASLPEVEGLIRALDKSGEGRKDVLHTSMSEKNSLLVTCAPAQHWCSRTPFDRNRRLWCSYAVHATPASSQNIGFSSQTHSFYFAGDTGLPPEFPLHHMIGDRLGPFDLAAIPIGAYEPNWFMRESHCNPSEAVKIHQAIRSKRSVAVHFDTFDLADEPRDEPPRLLLEEVDRVNKEILNMAVEVVTVADEVGISADLDAVVLPIVLPPLVDFAVIKHGQSISSAPTAIDEQPGIPEKVTVSKQHEDSFHSNNVNYNY
jgi:N-acyl-phosphatidylethanolamine-hydrolysing phospholipase D